jgi:PAS domain S-box-containing protein
MSLSVASLRPAAIIDGWSAVFDNAPSAIFAVNDNGRIVYANHFGARKFGFDRQELLGQAIEVLVPEPFRGAHHTKRQAFGERAVAGVSSTTLDLSGRRKDGTIFPAELTLVPVESSEGTMVFAMIVNTGPRKAAEDARAETERVFRLAVEASPNVVIAVNADGHIVYVNPQVETGFGYRSDELIGKPAELLVPGALRTRHVDHRVGYGNRPIARGMGIGVEIMGQRKDGTVFPIDVSLAPVETADGLQVFVTIIDLARRKSIESQQLQTQKLESIGRLAGGIAHDFNNMLFAILGYAELLEQDLASNEQARRDPSGLLTRVKAISKTAERAAELTAQLLAFSRQQILMVKVFNLNDEVTSVEPMLNQLIGTDIRLVLKLDPKLGHIRADAGQINQVIVNLVVNARDAMPAGGTVTIETSNREVTEEYSQGHVDMRSGSYVLLTVSDNGIGMDRATRDRLFEPFFSTKVVGKGTGLGLATAYGVVHQAGGQIWVYSELGQGSTFKLFFPRVEATAAELPVIVPTAVVGVGRVLFVEDDPSIREVISELLGRAGCQVRAVGDAAEALVTAATEGPFDVLVTDVVMPGISGIRLAEQVMDLYPATGVVLLSGYTAETLDLGRVIAGGATFVGKPITSNKLLEAVLGAAALRRTGRKQ